MPTMQIYVDDELYLSLIEKAKKDNEKPSKVAQNILAEHFGRDV